MEKQPALVGPEAMTAHAIGKAALLEVLDAELGATIEVTRRSLTTDDQHRVIRP